MRKLLSLVIFLVVLVVHCEIMTINLKDGSTVTYDIGSVEQITFSNDTGIGEKAEFLSRIPIKLLKNYPNPFNPVTNISFTLEKSGRTLVQVYNINGQLVKTLLNKELEAGSHQINWKGVDSQNRKMASGQYFYSVNLDGKKQIKKMIMIK